MGFASQVSAEVQLAASFDVTKLQSFKNQTILQPLAGAGDQPKEGGFMPNSEKAAPNAEQKGVTEVVAKTNPVDVSAVAAKAIADFQAKETARKQGIRAAFGTFASAHSDLLAACVEDNECSIDKARESLLAKIGEGTKPQEGGFSANLAHAGNGQIVKESMVAAIKSRAGVKMEANELSSDNPYRGMTLVEVARASLADKGVGTTTYGDRMSLVGAAFTHSSSDFGSVLADVANKAMLKGYDESGETFEQWTQRGTLSDFKTSNRVDLNSFPSLDKIREGGEYKYATMGERGEKIALATYGKAFSITRQAIINDDLSAFTVIPTRMGRAAIRTVGNLVYAVLIDNPEMSDGTSLFHADHTNYVTGASTALDVAALTAARKNFRLQKDADGTSINIMPEYLIVPASLETEAGILMNDTVYPGKSNNQRNPVAGMANVVVESRLDAASATAWYLAAGAMHDTIEVAYLDGNSSPFLDQMEGWNVDGTSFKVRLDAGVAPLDFRTMYKSKGAA